jgi:predicted nucleic acid-binding Zn ribbon protein
MLKCYMMRAISSEVANSGGIMNIIQELLDLASPTCDKCGAKVIRVEMSWTMNGDGDWVPHKWYQVCKRNHRKRVEPI